MAKNRKHSIIDRLPPDIHDAVDEMIKADFTYREIVDYIKKNGIEISIGSVHRYAKNLNETVQSLRMAQENFRVIMEETEKYPNLDVTEAILRLLSSQMLEAINKMPMEQITELDFETLTKYAVAVSRAASYKRNVDVKNKTIIENGADEFKSLIFEAMAVERPELYKEMKKFLKSKEVKS